MALDRLTKIDGGGISTTSDYRVGIITARKFIGPFDGTGGNFTGVITATDGIFSGNVTIGGTLTYEDVTNIDSVGIITARDGIHVGAGISAVGVITASSFHGDGSNLTGIDATALKDPAGNIKIQAQASGAVHTGIATFQDLDVDGHTNLDNVSVAGVTTFSDSDIFFKNSGITSCRFDSDLGRFSFNSTGGFDWYKNGNLSSNSGATIYYSENAVPNGYGGLVIQAPWSGQTNAKHIKVMGSSNGYFDIQNNLNGVSIFRAAFEGGVDLKYYQQGTKLQTTATGVTANQNLTVNKDLDVDGHTNLDNVSIAGVTTGTIFKVPDATDAAGTTNHIAVGDNSDLKLYHDNNGDAYISNATGHLTIRNNTSGKIINLQPKSGANGVIARYEGAVELYWNGGKRFETGDTVNINSNHFEITSGQQLRFDNSNNDRSSEILNTGSSGNSTLAFKTNGGTRWTIDSSGHFEPGTAGAVNIGSATAEIGDVYIADNKKAYFGSDQDFHISHNGSHAIVKETTGRLYVLGDDIWFKNQADNESLARFMNGGEVFLYNNDNLRLTTTATGITVGGEVAASQDYPNFQPTIDFNFAKTKVLDPRITYSRSGPASFTNEFGKIQLVGDDTPRFDHDPTTRECKGLLIEGERRNFAIYSLKINNDLGSYYNLINNAILISDAGEAPDGTTTATKMIPGSSGGARGIEEVYTLPVTGEYTTSVYVKAAGHTGWIALYGVNGGTRAYFNPSTGTAGQPGTYPDTPAAGKYGIEDAGNGWYRCHLTVNLTSTGSTEYFYIYFGDSDGSTSVTHSGTNGILMWGLQVELGSFPTSYIPTTNKIAIRGADFTSLRDDDFTDAISQTEGTLIAEYDNVTNDGYVLSLDTGGNGKIGMVNSNSYQMMGHDGANSQGLTDNGTLLSGTNRFALAYKTNDAAISINGNTATVDTVYALPTTTFMSIGHRQNQYDHLGSCIARIMYYNTRLPNSQLKTLTS